MEFRKPRFLILDLDGTLLDGERRQHALYSELLNERGFPPVSASEYRDWKRRKLPLEEQLAASDAIEIADWFRKEWLNRIESDELLELDSVIHNALQILQEWRRDGISLLLATQRRNEDGVLRQLERTGIGNHLHRAFVCPHSEGAKGKSSRIAEFLADVDPLDCIWIGDTEIDIEAARLFGSPVIAVTTGVRDRAFLSSLSPDAIVGSLDEIRFTGA